jgi:hypothetical protein
VVLVIYRGVHTAKVTPEGRRYGETGGEEDGRAQLGADRTGFTVARDKRALLRAVVCVVDGLVTRVREVRDGPWHEDARGKVTPAASDRRSPPPTRLAAVPRTTGG